MSKKKTMEPILRHPGLELILGPKGQVSWFLVFFTALSAQIGYIMP